jgi:hypothetical protein
VSAVLRAGRILFQQPVHHWRHCREQSSCRSEQCLDSIACTDCEVSAVSIPVHGAELNF